MRKGKNFLTLLLCVLVACVMLVACQPAVDPVQLVGFEDVTWTAELGETYTLPSGTALDTKDNDYRVTYTVKTKSGVDVTVSTNQFIVTDMAGYVITGVTDTLPDGTTKTRTITLNVEDKSAPDIMVESAGFGYAGRENNLPKITVTDLSGETITPVVKVYLVEGATETEITVANGKFTPTKKGKYRLNVSATDSAGNKGEKDVEILVRGEMAPYVLEDFGDEYGNQTLTGNKAGVDSAPATWMQSYDPTPEDNANDDAREGVSAVVSTLNSYGPHLYVRLPNEIRTANFEYVYARVYVKSEIAEYRPTFEAFTWNHKLGDFPVNEWVEVRLSVADINSENANFSSPGMKQEGKTPMEVFRDSITSGSGTYLFWIPMREYKDGNGKNQSDNPNNYTIYFDEIGYRPTFTPVLETKEQYELGETITLNATVDTQLDESTYSFVYTVRDPSGNAVTLDENNSFRAIETGKYSVTVDFIHNEYSGTASYELNVVGNKEIVIGEFTDTPAMGDTVTVPSGSLDGGTVTVSVLCNGTTVEMDGNSFVASVAGVYEVVYAAEIDGLIYKTVLEIEVEHALADNEILGFNRVEDIDSLIFGTPGWANAEWLPSFEGHDGVAKITYGGSDWPWLSFVPAYEMSAYENSAYIMVRMYVASGGNELSYMVLGNDGLIQSKPDGYDGTVAYDKWEDYKFDAKPFLEFWTDGMINSDKARLWFFSKDASAEGTIYISDIYVISNPAASGIELVVVGDKRDGQQLTVAMDVPSDVTGAQMTVKDPNGEVVTLTNGKFTAVKGVYTVEITCDGYPGVWKQTFEVVDAYDVTINGDAVVDGKNVTLPTVTVSNPVTGDDVTDDATVEVAVAYGETAITVTDNKFTGTFAGFYEVTWTINYEGKTVIKTYSVLIEGSDEIQEGEVEFFSTPASLDRVEMGTTTGKSYVNDAPNGATHGSVAFDLSQVGGVDGNNWPRLAVAARQEKSAYENADAIALTIKIVGKEGATVELVFWSDNSERVVVPLNVWTTVTVSAEKFLANFDHLGVLEEAKGWFWFTNINANTAHKFLINEIKVVAKLTSENALLDLKNEGALLSVSSSGITEYVSAADVNEDSTLPALPQGENAYIKFTGKGNSWAFFDVRIDPMCSEEVFVNADALEFSVYTSESRSIYFYNTNLGPTTAGEWTKIVLPISIWNATKNIYKNYGSAEDWYNSLVNDSAPFVSIVGVSSTTDETMYLSSVRFVDIPEDETLGDKYAHISTDTVSVNRGSVEQGTYFGKEAVKITSTNTWVNVFVKPGKTEKELRQYTKARFSVYLEGSVNVELYSQRQANGTEGNDFVPYGFAKPGQWVELEVSVDRLLDLYAECYLGINAFMIDRGAAFDALYLADIVLVKEIEGVTITVTEGALREGDEVTVGYTNENNVDGLTLTVTNGEGVEVVLDGGKFVAEADNYTVTISKDGYDPLVKTFTVYPAIEVEIGDAVINGREVTIGTPVIKDPSTGDAITEGVSVSVTVTFGGNEITLGSGAKFIAAYAGTYVVTYTVNYNDKGYDYTDEVVVVNDAPKANEVLSFSSADELVKVDMGVNNITFTEEWLAEFEGETGVVKYTFSGGDWPYMGFGTNQDMSAYADYDYLTVTFYAPSAGNSIKYLKLGANTEKDTWPIGYESTIEKDKWHTYVFDITVFKNHWKPNLNEFDWNNLYKLWFYSTSTAEGTFYVSDISVMKGASKAGLIVKTEGELREGKTFSVSYETPNEIANVTMVVKAPDGSVVDDVTAITGVYGTYTVEFTCDGYYGVGIEEFNVVPAIEFTVGELSYADGVITIPTYSITNPADDSEITDAEVTVSASCANSDITVTDDEFNAVFGGGTYIAKWTVVYDGKTYTYEKSITVDRAPVAENEVHLFADASSIDDVTSNTMTGKSYVLDAPEGATHGSICIDITQTDGDNWPHFAVAPRQDKSVYADYMTVEITLKIVAAEGGDVQTDFWSNNDEVIHIPSNVWTTVKLNATYLQRDYDVLGDAGKGWFWIMNGGGKHVQKLLVHEIKVSEKSTAELVKWNETSVANTAQYYTSVSQIDADDIATDDTLPALPDGATSYVKITGNTNAWTVLEFKANVTASFGTFASADYYEFDYYAPGEGTRRVYHHNNLILTANAGEWTTVRIPLEYFNYMMWPAEQLAKEYASLSAWYADMVKGIKSLVNFWDLGESASATVYVTDVRLGVNERDNTLGDKFTHLNTTTVTVNNGATEMTTFDGKEALKITSTDTWVNISVAPGKTIGELSQYNKLVVKMYIEGSNALQLYSQDVIYSTSNRFYFYGNENGADGGHVYATGQWVDVEIPMSHVIQLYDVLDGRSDGLGHALMVDRGKAFTAIYISDIVCVK